MNKLGSIINVFRLGPGKIWSFIKKTPRTVTFFLRDSLTSTLSFIFLLIIYLATSFLTSLLLSKWLPLPWNIKNSIVHGINEFYQRIVKMNHLNEDSINRTNLIQLALYNMRFKKSRTFITVGGMAIGIAAIVYLVSIGYGLQELVISRVARLEEMRQANISSPVGGRAKINDQTVIQMKEIAEIDKVMPQIAAVGRVNYNNSLSDVVVYGVTADYLIHSAIKPSSGKIFENNDLSIPDNALLVPAVAGVETQTADAAPELGATISTIDFTINEGSWLRIRESPNAQSKLLGYTRRVEGTQSGEEVWGRTYNHNERPSAQDTEGNTYHRWVKANVRLWQKTICETTANPDCEADGQETYLLQRDEDGDQASLSGYLAALNMQIQPVAAKKSGAVLGIDTDVPQVLQSETESENADSDFIELQDESTTQQTENIKKVDLPSTAIKEVVVNKAMLQLLGIEEASAIDKTFTLSFVVVGELLESAEEKLESLPAEYKIVGIVPDDRTPILYVPFIDLRSIGVINYSQAKVLVKNQETLPKVRTQIEALGFTTQSVSDTVAQINNLFATARTVLFLVGMAALAVASLGMFNTLTVSLLERTREVGLMKAMGMRSSEVHELFLTESMIMGLFGGFAGITLGVLAGQATSLALSAYAVSKGVGYLNISYTPPVFIIVILTLAMIVGLITGLYPARHATRISALNALRYE